MNAGCLSPLLHRVEEMIAHLLKACPIQIVLLRKIVLITVLAAETAKVGDVPLDVKLLFHRFPKEILPSNHSKIKADEPQILRSLEHLFRLSA